MGNEYPGGTLSGQYLTEDRHIGQAQNGLLDRFRRDDGCDKVTRMFGIICSVITLPFRVLIAVVELLGRLTGVFVGFGLMVVGAALSASSFFILGIPVFVIGLVMTLRCLG